MFYSDCQGSCDGFNVTQSRVGSGMVNLKEFFNSRDASWITECERRKLPFANCENRYGMERKSVMK